METIIYIFIFGLGMIIGSFINCASWRIYKDISLMGRSFCPKCKHQIAWYDNLPVFSFIALKAKCRHCSQPISFQHPLVEIITGLLFVLVYYVHKDIASLSGQVLLVRNLLAITVLMIIFIQDFKWHVILDKVSIPAILLFFVFNLVVGMNWINMLFSGIIGGSFFLLQYVVSRGKWIGGGDIRLGFLMGILLGWPNIILAIFMAYMIGAIVSLYLLSRRKKGMKSEVPLGTFLAPATLITLLWGEGIIAWYLSFLYL